MKINTNSLLLLILAIFILGSGFWWYFSDTSVDKTDTNQQTEQSITSSLELDNPEIEKPADALNPEVQAIENRSLSNIQVEEMSAFDFEDTKLVNNLGLAGGSYKTLFVTSSDLEKVESIIKTMDKLSITAIKDQNHPKYEESGKFLLGKMSKDSGINVSSRYPNFSFYILKGEESHVEMVFADPDTWEFQIQGLISALDGLSHFSSDPKEITRNLLTESNLTVYKYIEYYLDKQSEEFQNKAVDGLKISESKDKYDYKIYFNHLNKTTTVSVEIGGREQILYKADFSKGKPDIITFEDNSYYSEFRTVWEKYNQDVFSKGAFSRPSTRFGANFKSSGDYNRVFFGNFLNSNLFPFDKDSI